MGRKSYGSGRCSVLVITGVFKFLLHKKMTTLLHPTAVLFVALVRLFLRQTLPTSLLSLASRLALIFFIGCLPRRRLLALLRHCHLSCGRSSLKVAWRADIFSRVQYSTVVSCAQSLSRTIRRKGTVDTLE